MAAPSVGKSDTKRKREVKAVPARKRARSESESEGSSEDDDQDDRRGEILLLENEILESKKNYNNIAKLIQIAQDNTDDATETALVASVALCRVFIRLLSAGTLSKKKGTTEKELVVVHWLKDRLSEYKSLLSVQLRDDGLASTALTLAMRLLKAEAQHIPGPNDDYSFSKSYYTDIVETCLAASTKSGGPAQALIESFVSQYDDVRFHTFRAIADIYRTSQDAPPFEMAFEILSSIDNVPDSKAEMKDLI